MQKCMLCKETNKLFTKEEHICNECVEVYYAIMEEDFKKAKNKLKEIYDTNLEKL